MMAIFLDTSYLLARLNRADQYHGQAKELARRIRGPFVTTEAVLLELANALSNRKYRLETVAVIKELKGSSQITVVSLTPELFNRGLELYNARSDKDWGLTDCISFLVMGDYSIEEALTADRHFSEAGFQTLMRV